MENNKLALNSSSTKYNCEHGKHKYRCSICGGSQLCVHNKIKYTCKQCLGSQRCSHNRIKYTCFECFGSQRCSHNRIKYTCFECSGSKTCSYNKQKYDCKMCSDPIKVTIQNWLRSTRQSDRKYNRYDADRFIDKCFLKGHFEDYPTCYYEDCKTPLQYTEYQYNLATIERIDNSIGHIKCNCVLCCLSCNLKKKSNLTSKE